MREPIPSLSWERKWQSSKVIAEEIRQADICLGIFGAGDKAQRVCPFKLYAYASIGRAVITGETLWLRESAQPPHEAFASVPVNEAAALAAKIIQLADAPMLREKLAENSHQFYESHLSNQAALEQLAHLFVLRGSMHELD